MRSVAPLLAWLPGPVRSRLRRLRSLAALGRSRARRLLPAWAGGPLGDVVEARLLSASDTLAYQQLTGHDVEPIWAPDRGMADTPFGIGLFLDTRLVAVGCCHRQWKHLGIEAHFFAGDLVSRPFRGRGLAKALHRARLREARRRGIRTAYTVVFTDNQASLRGYTAAGFCAWHEPDWSARIEQHFREIGSGEAELAILYCRLG